MNVHPNSLVALSRCRKKYRCRHWVEAEEALEPVGPDTMDGRQFCPVTGNRNTSVGRPACNLFTVGCAFMSSVQESNSRLPEKYFYLRRMFHSVDPDTDGRKY
jgi:hypothetical protein